MADLMRAELSLCRAYQRSAAHMPSLRPSEAQGNACTRTTYYEQMERNNRYVDSIRGD